jgi:hypothetical protein
VAWFSSKELIQGECVVYYTDRNVAIN